MAKSAMSNLWRQRWCAAAIG